MKTDKGSVALPHYLIRAWRHLRQAKLTAYALLLFGPMFLRPTAFVRYPKGSQPIYARLPGMWGTPLLAATLYADAMQSFYEWLAWREMLRPESVMPAADYLYHLHFMRSDIGWWTLGVAFIVFYVLALLRWLYHFGSTRVLRRWRSDILDPPFKYFVVTTAAWGLWFGLAAMGMTLGLWQSGDGDLQCYFEPRIEPHAGVFLVCLLAVSAFMHLAAHNSQVGMKALYGGSRKLLLLVEAVPFSAALLVLWLVAHQLGLVESAVQP